MIIPGLFRKLTEKEEKEFREWARKNPKENCKINIDLIHPVVKNEWENIAWEKAHHALYGD